MSRYEVILVLKNLLRMFLHGSHEKVCIALMTAIEILEGKQ